MRIGPTESGQVMTFEQTRRAQDRQIQSLFSQILEDVGREGYRSAEPFEHELANPTASDDTIISSTAIHDSWNSWYATELRGRYRSIENKKQLGTAFGDILQKAQAEGAYIHPKAFLKSLTREQLETVQHVQGLADAVEIDQLNEEGALNLLLPPAAQIDLNKDGLTQSGKAYGIRFPDSTTPPDVAAAWDEATKDMDLGQRMMYELQIKMPVLLANIVLNSDGTFSHQIPPGDPEFKNPMIDAEYSYIDVTQRHIDYLNDFKNQIEPVRFEKDMAFWKQFQKLLRD